MGMEMQVDGVKKLQEIFRNVTQRAPQAVKELNQVYADRLVSRAAMHALKDTGYLASNFKAVFSDGGLTVDILNPTPYWPRRGPLGFVGVDSLGRHYSDPPHPDADRALEELWPQYVEDLQNEVPRWFT